MPAAKSGLLPLGELLSDSVTFMREYWKPILTMAVLLGTIGAVVGGTVAYRASTGMSGLLNQMGMDSNKVQELSVRIKNGDQAAIAEMQKMVSDKSATMDENANVALGRRMFAMFIPVIGTAIILGLIIFMFGYAFFLLLAVSPTQDVMKTLRGALGLFFPLIGLCIWIALRSFIWIPFLGIIPAIILGPRFSFAPYLLVTQKKGILESARMSYRQTNGYWGKIFGNMIVAALCAGLASMVIGMIIGIIGLFIPLAAIWLASITKMLTYGFTTVFSVYLAKTVLANPMTVAIPAKTKKK